MTFLVEEESEMFRAHGEGVYDGDDFNGYGDNTIEASFDLKDYISVLAKKGKNSKLTESMMSDIANQMISKNI